MTQYMDPNNQTVDEKVDNTLRNLGSGQRDEILRNFDSFKRYLGKRIEMAEKFGLNEEQLAKTAEKVANYLADHEEPRNSEEKLLQELWKVGSQEEQHKLAHMLVKLAQSSS
ncbi:MULTISPECIES: DUF3243 domain-containing protein [unclassified Paenibacillus]|uniref:DUF3243 domain-containing protein n=1 Tax=unclassified Paenibacillus TaxID=185978 RepID=UPI001AE49FBF|nr:MULTISPECIES: DUF3243 domain-containing protein [unclassified Paenibacillus]MBP1155801.1 hypothetical protein [Paenibacillus sp. PvP091]MBP1168813.1 hypothetical protein [Paenibacillus sp. PvR098]MBP2439841.1 hypothetical protein [Paenibacillus sp. PvP052]